MLVYQRVCYMFFVRKCWLSVVGFPFKQPEATARTTPHLCDQTNKCNREFTNKMQMSSLMQSQATSTIINHHQPTCFFVLLSTSINQCPHRFNGFWVSSAFCKAGLFSWEVDAQNFDEVVLKTKSLGSWKSTRPPDRLCKWEKLRRTAPKFHISWRKWWSFFWNLGVFS